MLFGVIFAIFISVILPVIAFVYACLKKRYFPFLLGVIAFVGSQILFRIPILQYLQNNSISYTKFSVVQPVLFVILIGLSAGIVEEIAGFIMIRYFMKQRDWQAGFLFGAGHGGIEALLLVGVSVVPILFSITAPVLGTQLFVGGIERLFAMLLHIGLSIIVLQGVVKRKFFYVLMAILIHGFVDSLVGLVPLFMNPQVALIVVEVSLAVIAIAVFSYSLFLKRKGALQ